MEGGGELAVQPGSEDALIESSFRRLLAAIESEKARVRAEALRVETERQETIAELDGLRNSTQTWCVERTLEIRAAWEKLDETADVMKKLLVQGDDELIEIHCGPDEYTLPRSLLEYEDSYLGPLFRGDDVGVVMPKDEHGRFIFDVDPESFRIIVEFLQTKRLAPQCPTPTIPPYLWKNMEVLLDALNIKAFNRQNRINRFTHTSLKVAADRVEAMYDGWQVITAEDPMSTSRDSYFEVIIDKNIDPKGGLALGLMGHVPVGDEVHSLFQEDAVLYNSNNGLMGAAHEAADLDVQPNIPFAQGCTVGIYYNPTTGSVTWYLMSPYGASPHFENVGSAQLKTGLSETIYPAFALYAKRTVLVVDFNAEVPKSIREDGKRDQAFATSRRTLAAGGLPPPRRASLLDGMRATVAAPRVPTGVDKNAVELPTEVDARFKGEVKGDLM